MCELKEAKKIMMIQPINRLNANNAAYNWMNSADALRNLAFTGNGNMRSLLQAENNLNIQMLNDSVIYQASLLMEKSQDKVNKENIKRTFSMFM